MNYYYYNNYTGINIGKVWSITYYCPTRLIKMNNLRRRPRLKKITPRLPKVRTSAGYHKAWSFTNS